MFKKLDPDLCVQKVGSGSSSKWLSVALNAADRAISPVFWIKPHFMEPIPSPGTHGIVFPSRDADQIISYASGSVNDPHLVFVFSIKTVCFQNK